MAIRITVKVPKAAFASSKVGIGVRVQSRSTINVRARVVNMVRGMVGSAPEETPYLASLPLP